MQIGCLFKFPPAGGNISRATLSGAPPVDSLTGNRVPQYQMNADYNGYYQVTGASWQFFGISPQMSFENAGDPTCGCFAPRFTVDDYGRIFYPEAFSSSVGIIDNNKNLILRFGEYGNVDQTGPGSAVPSPNIPLNYPIYVQQVNDHVYISDIGAERVLRVKLSFTDSAVVQGLAGVEHAVKAPGAMALTVKPDPFNPCATLAVRNLAKGVPAQASVYSVDGRLVCRLQAQPGTDNVFVWDGRDASGRGAVSGIYVFSVKAGAKTLKIKATLLK
jgi:hypothetical protein